MEETIGRPRHVAGRVQGQPTLVVLPFLADRADDDTALMALGLTESICGELTRFRGLRVIAPASAAQLAAAGDSEIGERLAASHVVRGHLRRSGSQLQLDTTLSSTRDATHLWSERLDVPEGEIHALETEIIGRTAATLNARLEEDLLAAAPRSVADLAPHLATLRGFRLLRDGTLESDELARGLFEHAVAIDSGFARAHAGIAFSWFNEWSCQYWSRFEENGRLAYSHAHAALALDDRDALLHQVLGKVHLMRRDYERASWYFDRALALCPNDADLLIAQSVYSACLGDPSSSVTHATRAMRLHPFHPNAYFGLAAIAHLLARDAATASGMFFRSDGPPYVGIPAFHAIALGHLGRIDEARAAFEEFLERYRDKIAYGATPDPAEAVRWFFDFYPFRSDADSEFLMEGFRHVGPDAAAPGRSATGNRAIAHRFETAPDGTDRAPRQADRRRWSADPIPRLEREGAGWSAEYEGLRVILPDLKGLHDIRRLMDSCGKEIHCLDLDERIVEAPGGTVLDEKARAALKARVRDLQEDLAEAEDANDVGRAERLREEMDGILDALSAALGLGGRGRRLGDSGEKARTAVTWRIRHALRRIEAVHPAMGRHLARRLKTGTFCLFTAE